MSDAREVIALELWRCKDKADNKGNKLTSNQFADAIIAALSAAGMEIRKSVDLKKHYSWCCLVDTECNCGGREAASDE